MDNGRGGSHIIKSAPKGGDQHVQEVIRTAHEELRQLMRQRAEIMKRIGTVKHARYCGRMGAGRGSGCLIPLRVNSRRLVQVEYRPESGGILGRLSLARYSLLICASCRFHRP